MKKRCAFLAALFLCPLALLTAHAADPADNLPFDTIRGELRGLDGKPAAGRTLYLVGIDRFSLHRGSDDAWLETAGPAAASWKTRTDDSGRFSFRLWRPLEGQPRGGWDSLRPGPGIYHIVAKPGPADAGAVSEAFNNGSLWRGIGRAVPGDISLTLQIVRGVTVRGQIVDARTGAPLSGVDLFTYTDLHSTTHTGYGGEINGVAATTDKRGRFTLRNVYPDFTLNLRGPRTPSWLKTHAGGKWTNEVLDEWHLKQTSGDFPLGIAALCDPVGAHAFRYFGRVVDAAGRPVADARVGLGVSSHRAPRTWGDNHSYPDVQTRADGTWECFTRTPWVRGMDAEKGKLRTDRDWNNPALYPPGRYDFTLPAAPIPER